jgi:hypothetical protein
MNSKTLYPSQSSGINQVFVTFELLGAATSALTIPSDGAGAPWVASVSRSGVGIFVVTLKDAWNKVLFKSAELDDTLNDGAYATCSNVANENTGTALTFTIRTRSAAGAAADPAAARRIGVTLVLRNGVQLGGG